MESSPGLGSALRAYMRRAGTAPGTPLHYPWPPIGPELVQSLTPVQEDPSKWADWDLDPDFPDVVAWFKQDRSKSKAVGSGVSHKADRARSAGPVGGSFPDEQ